MEKSFPPPCGCTVPGYKTFLLTRESSCIPSVHEEGLRVGVDDPCSVWRGDTTSLCPSPGRLKWDGEGGLLQGPALITGSSQI